MIRHYMMGREDKSIVNDDSRRLEISKMQCPARRVIIWWGRFACQIENFIYL